MAKKRKVDPAFSNCCLATVSSSDTEEPWDTSFHIEDDCIQSERTILPRRRPMATYVTSYSPHAWRHLYVSAGQRAFAQSLRNCGATCSRNTRLYSTIAVACQQSRFELC